MNKWLKLDRIEKKKVLQINDPIVELILINGWRRSEVSQAIMSYDGSVYAYFTPKKQNKVKQHLLTKREQELLNGLKTLFSGTKNTIGAYNKKIHRHFEVLSNELGFNIFPHRLRATFGTELSRMGVSPFTIKAAMNHKKLKTTEGYIQPDQEDIVEAKELNTELMTIDGMTIHEWRKFALDKVKQLRRLEERSESKKQ